MSTYPDDSALPPRRSVMGHEDAFPASRLSARSRFSQRTFAGKRGNGRDAPIPAVRWMSGTDGLARIAVIRGRYGNRPDQQPVVARVDHGMIHSEARSRRGPQMSATPDSTLANPDQRIADLERQL